MLYVSTKPIVRELARVATIIIQSMKNDQAGGKKLKVLVLKVLVEDVQTYLASFEPEFYRDCRYFAMSSIIISQNAGIPGILLKSQG